MLAYCRNLFIFVVGLALGGLLVFSGATARAEPSILCLSGKTCLDQGWSDAERNGWYRMSQGSRLLPLDWMQALELSGSQEKFLSPAHVKKLGYLADPVSPANPHGLPVGFTIDQDNSRSADLMCETFPSTCANKTMRRHGWA